MTFVINITVILISYLLTFALTFGVRGALVKRALLDRPNERSSHTNPTPRGGGWALLVVLVPGLMLTAITQHTLPHYLPLIAGVLLLAAISWWDDVHSLNPLARLSAHLMAAFMGSLALPDHAMVLGGILPFLLDRLMMIIGWAWFINLTNFMDGIDGITGIETITISTGVALALSVAAIDDPFLDVATLLLTGTCLGFLALNWHPAKIFLGDVGSVPLGYLSGFILITLAAKGYVVAALILPLYYLADSGITITKRALRGEKIWQAHRQHFYQRAAARLGGHDKVVRRIVLANIALIISALIAITTPWLGLGLAVFSVVLLLHWMHKVGVN
jgi:UDP-N-acetylmuramyl pentapeptide phosphotransferase/UDP-N-acetylglucosamine-1-phosphate transferase